MSEWDAVIGRTIVGVVEEDEYGDVTLALDDGTHLRLVAQGYEADGIGVTILDREAQNARIRRRMGEQHRRWLSKLQADARWAALSPQERATRERSSAAMKNLLMGAWMDTAKQMNRQVFGGTPKWSEVETKVEIGSIAKIPIAPEVDPML